MVVEAPVAFGVTHNGETTNLLPELTDATVMDNPAFVPDFLLPTRGMSVFAMEPHPYWKPG